MGLILQTARTDDSNAELKSSWLWPIPIFYVYKYIYIYTWYIHDSWIQWENNQHSTTRLFDWGITCEFTEKTVTASNNSCSPSNMVMTSFSRFAAGFKGGSVSSTGCSRASMSRLKKICLKGSRKMIFFRKLEGNVKALDEHHSGPLKHRSMLLLL